MTIDITKPIWNFHNPYEWLERTRKSAFPPLIICAAITGGVHGKEANPNLPETPEEQVEQTITAYEAGASMVHIHVRDPQKWWDGSPSAERYRMVNRMIRQACPEIIINNTTGGSFGMTMEGRLACLDAQPEVATLNMGPDMYKIPLKERKAPLPSPRDAVELNGVVPVTYGELRSFAQGMMQRGIKPEMEVYNPGQLWPVFDLIELGLVEKPYFIQFVTGYQASPWATPRNLINAVEQLPSDTVLEVSGIAQFQLPMVNLAIILGAHMVRVGLEDNVFYRRGRLYKDNAEAVKRVVNMAHELNREVATPTQARAIMGISTTPSQY